MHYLFRASGGSCGCETVKSEEIYWLACFHPYCDFLGVGDLKIQGVKFDFLFHDQLLLSSLFHYNKKKSFIPKTKG